MITVLLFADVAALANALHFYTQKTEAIQEMEILEEASEYLVSQLVEENDDETIFKVEKQFAFIGEHEYDPTYSPEDDVFTFNVNQLDEEKEFVYLKYEAKGVQNPAFLPKSVNQGEVYTGGALEADHKWRTATVKLDRADVKDGINQVRFAVPRNSGLAVEIKNVELQFSANPKKAYKAKRISREPAQIQDFRISAETAVSIPTSTFKNKDVEMASIPKSIQNITRNAYGYGARKQDAKMYTVAVGVDADRLLQLDDMKEAHVFYYDTKSNNWKPAHTAKVDMDNMMLEANVPGNTDYFAGLIKTPDMPEASAFLPTGVSDIKAANPATGINIMSPPQQSKTGEAAINYPLSIPAGRKGLNPSLSVNYSSDAGTGWMGVGWNISTPSISIDTRWGVPTFPSHQEEVYALNGQALVQEGGTKGNRATVVSGSPVLSPRLSGNVRFFPHTMSGYKEVERRGTSPTNYVWVETMANKTKHYYGTMDGASVNDNSVLKSGDNIVQWYLTKIEDQWGNTVTYEYDKTQYTGNSSSIKNNGTYIVPQVINYTGFNGADGKYDINFITSGNRRDGTVSMSYGTKVVDDRQLDKITVEYDGVEVKNFRFDYTPVGDFYKTRLNTLGEYRGNELFYEHTFEYYPGDLSFGNEETLLADNIGTKLVSAITGDLDFLKKPILNIFNPSAIKTTGTFGWSTGGGVGVGIAPIGSYASGKRFTFSGSLGYSESLSFDVRSLKDMNGDGIPDMVADYMIGKGYYPITRGSGGLEVGPFTSIHNQGRPLMNTSSSSWNYGFDFTLGDQIFYYGKNWTRGTNIVSNYLTDYNSDGFSDLVIADKDGSSRILFGKMNDLGEVTYETNSANTPNPVLKLNSLSTVDANDDDLKDIEMVKTWTAPFEGTVNITGDAQVFEDLSGTVRVAVQHNDMLLGPGFSSTDANTPVGANFGSVSVTKGDVIMFRARSDVDGQQDLLTWNPRVEYQEQVYYDGNDIEYTDSRYEDAFILSGSEPITVDNTQDIKVDLNRSLAQGLTDDLVYTFTVVELDDEMEVLGTRVFTNTVLAGNTSLNNTTFTYTPTSGSNQTINLSGGSFVSIPNTQANHFYTFYFGAFSTSNVDWRDVKFRPTVEIAIDNCEAKTTRYPTVDFGTYNRVGHMGSKFPSNSVTYNSSKSYRVWPGFSYTSSDVAAVFGNVSGSNTSSAYLTVKNAGNRYSRLKVTLNQSNNQVSFSTCNDEGKTIAAVNSTTAPTVYKLDNPQFSNNLYVEFFVDGQVYADKTRDFILNELSSIALQEYTGSTWSTLTSTSNNYNLFSKDNSYLGDKILHWGQFGWSFESSVSENTPINPEDLEPDFAGEASNQDNQFDEGNTPGDDFFERNEDALNPLTQKFFMLKAERGEKAHMLRTYQADQYEYLESESLLSPTVSDADENLDRYSFAGTHMAIYASAGVSSPGKLGEMEIVPVSGSNTVGNGAYTAYGVPLVTKSKTSASTKGALGASMSETTDNANKYYSYSVSQFQDFNGDGYPDKLEDDGTDVNINFTNPLGGHKSETQLTSADLSKSISDNKTASIPASFVNKDQRFEKMGAPTANFGQNTESIQHMDINGDGLPDRLESTSSGITIALNNGSGFENPVSLTGYNGELSSSENSSFSLTYNLGKIDKMKKNNGASFSFGVGVNKVGNHTGTMFIDLTGDGLSDAMVLNEVNPLELELSVYINKGTSFQLHSTAISVDDRPNKGKGFGFSGSAAGTYAFPAFSIPILGIDVKVSVNANGGLNFSVNETESSFMDMNGDGKVDYVTKDGGLNVKYSQIDKSNLLKKVINPLKGSFTIEYQRVGNKVGYHDVAVKNHLNSGMKELWDMPNSKWVMSHLTMHDGYELEDANSNDLDGKDVTEVFFAYDGGIKSRRERAFLGFTRIEKKYLPSESFNDRNGTATDFTWLNNGSTQYKYYLTEVQQYMAPTSNAFDYRKRFEYQKDVLTETYTFYNKLTRTAHNHGEGVYTYTLDHEVYPININMYTHNFRNVCMDRSSASFNKLYDISSGEAAVEWTDITETQSVFPSVVEIQKVNYHKVTTAASRQKYFSQKYLLTYDNYWNVTQYEDQGELVARQPTLRLVDSYTRTYYDYQNQSNLGLSPGHAYHSSALSDDVYDVYEIPYSADATYSDHVLYVPKEASGCYGFTNTTYPTGEDDFDFVSTHKKQMSETVNVYAPGFNDVYKNKLIATMEYFDPSQANGQTGVLKRHKIYENAVQAANLKRHTEVAALQLGKAPRTIWNVLDGSNTAITDLDYDGYGNVIEVTGPLDDNNQRFVTSLTYDAEKHQHVIQVGNSYGETSYSSYDLSTGNLEKTVDINGHAMRYVYDNRDRLKQIFAPRELYKSGSAPTITFEYYPGGMSPSDIPVAITSHNFNTPIPSSTTNTPNSNIATLAVLTGRPSVIPNAMRTATFMDGMQRPIQVKKDAAKANSGNTGNDIVRQVSGFVKYDQWGKPEVTGNSMLETPTNYPIGSLYEVSSNPISTQQYDYAGRIKSEGRRVPQTSTFHQTTYQYNWLVHGTEEYARTQVIATDLTKTATLTNSRGQQKYSFQIDANGNKLITQFGHDLIGQLVQTIDPLGQLTTYTYDDFGRVIQEVHPDRGTTSNTYDLVGNLLEVSNPATQPNAIEYEYFHHRMLSKTMPQTDDLYSVSYTYGTKADGKNGAGRVVNVVQGTNFKTENYEYDEMGNLRVENKVINVPQVGVKNYTTEFAYDSWGRLMEMLYPDQEKVLYRYTTTGELEGITSQFSSGPTSSIIDQINYDGYSNMLYMRYGNQAETVFTYDSETRDMTNVLQRARVGIAVAPLGGTIQDAYTQNFTYDNAGRIDALSQQRSFHNVPISGSPVIASHSYDYEYDDYNRLEEATGTFVSQLGLNTYNDAFELSMAYNAAGGIVSKEQNLSSNYNVGDYDLGYTYDASKKHQVKTVVEQVPGASPKTYTYSFNNSGSIEEVRLNGNVEEEFVWNEEQWLMAVDNNNGYHHYIYDQNGERIMKSTLTTGNTAFGGQNSTNTAVLDPYALYVNSYYVTTAYTQNENVSKHYFMGSQRVCTEVVAYGSSTSGGGSGHEGDEGNEGENPEEAPNESQELDENGTQSVLNNLTRVLKDLGLEEGEDFNAKELNKPQEMKAYYQVPEGSAVTEVEGGNGNIVISRLRYWYHPNYLGNVDMVTDEGGYQHQYFVYSPFGENLYDWSKNSDFDSPYRFNGKEEDPETGNMYYGARYYDPHISTWLSVDPLAHEYSSLSPYNFVSNNPVHAVDPDGRKINWFRNFFSVLKFWWYSQKTTRGEQHWSYMANRVDAVYTFTSSNAVGIGTRPDGSMGVMEGMEFNSGNVDSKGRQVINIVYFMGTYEAKKEASERAGVENFYYMSDNFKRDLLNDVIFDENLPVYNTDINALEQSPSSYGFGFTPISSATAIPNDNETRGEYINRVGVHEHTHGLMEPGPGALWQNTKRDDGPEHSPNGIPNDPETMPTIFEKETISQQR